MSQVSLVLIALSHVPKMCICCLFIQFPTVSQLYDYEKFTEWSKSLVLCHVAETYSPNGTF